MSSLECRRDLLAQVFLAVGDEQVQLFVEWQATALRRRSKSCSVGAVCWFLGQDDDFADSSEIVGKPTGLGGLTSPVDSVENNKYALVGVHGAKDIMAVSRRAVVSALTQRPSCCLKNR